MSLVLLFSAGIASAVSQVRESCVLIDNDFDIDDMIWFVAFGAIVGDNISYYLGTHANQFFKHGNKIFKLTHVEKGERFFKKHGNGFKPTTI